MEKELTLHLLVVEESRNDAEALANILRNAGQASRLDYAGDPDSLEAALDRQAAELVLCATGLESISLTDLVQLLERKNLNIPVIAIGESADEVDIVAAMREGAVDLCSYDQPEHLQLVTRRELSKVQTGSDARNFEARFHESEKRARQLMESSRDAIAYIHEGMHVFANGSYLHMFGFDELEEIEGTPVLDMVAPEAHASFKEFLRSYGKDSRRDSKLDTRGMLPDGKQFDAEMEFVPASIDGEPCIQIIIRSQAESRRELEQKLQFLSKQDVLTGLFNRQYFMEELELAIADTISGSDTAGVVYLLMDNFKEIKDNLGIGAADMVLSDIADLIRKHTGDKDISARFTDHAFTILRRDCDADSLQELGECLRQTIENHIADVESQSVTTTTSIGMTIITESTPSGHELISRVDLACDVARSSGGNRTHLHNPVVDDRIGKERDQQMHSLIADALEQDQFALLFQPIVSLQGEQGEKYEVLLRLRGDDSDYIMPTQFLPIAEQTGQIADIDRWVIKHAIRTLAEHRAQGPDTRFFIKLCTATLLDEGLVAYIHQCIQENRLQSDALVFEIAEKGAAQHLKHARAFIKALQELHCKTALEHFGASPNSFQLLRHLPADYLKIDGSFIHNLASDNDNQAMVKSILDTARSMDKQCIAEFVQDAHSLAVLWQSGIDFIQGNFLQEPGESLNYDFTSEIA